MLLMMSRVDEAPRRVFGVNFLRSGQILQIVEPAGVRNPERGKCETWQRSQAQP